MDMNSVCPNCDTPLKAAEDTACVYLFTLESQFNHVDVLCECGQMWTLVLANQVHLLTLINEHDVPFQGMNYVPPKLKHQLMDIMERRNLREAEAEELGVFHDWLDEIVPDDFREEE